MKIVLILSLALFAILAGVFMLSPLFGQKPWDLAVNETIFRASWFLVLGPLGLFYFLHPTRHLEQKIRHHIDLLLGFAGLAAVAALLVFASGNYLFGTLSAVLAVSLLWVARKLWLRNVPRPTDIILEEGERLLANEKDVNERRKFAWALERFKKDWRP
jgi:hypothetical protein